MTNQGWGIHVGITFGEGLCRVGLFRGAKVFLMVRENVLFDTGQMVVWALLGFSIKANKFYYENGAKKKYS